MARRARSAADGLPRRLVCDRRDRAGGAASAIRLRRGRAGAPRARPAGARRLSAAALRVAAHARRAAGVRRRATPDTPVQLAYVNPETGGDCLNTLAFTALLLRPGEEIALPRISAARVFHAVEGTGDVQVNDTAIAFEHADTFCAPGLATGAAFEPLEPRSGVSRHRRRIATAAQARRVRAALTRGSAMRGRPRPLGAGARRGRRHRRHGRRAGAQPAGI